MYFVRINFRREIRAALTYTWPIELFLRRAVFREAPLIGLESRIECDRIISPLVSSRGRRCGCNETQQLLRDCFPRIHPSPFYAEQFREQQGRILTTSLALRVVKVTPNNAE